jgi:hypothetical protein
MPSSSRLLILTFVALLPGIAVEIFNQAAARWAGEVQIEEDALRRTKYFGAQQDRVVEGAQQLLITLSNLESVRTKDSATCARQFTRLLPNYQSYLAFTAYALDGRPFCSSIASAARAEDESFFRMVLENKRFAIGNYSSDRGVGILPFAHPILSDSGELLGVVEVQLKLAWMEAYFKEQLLLSKRGTSLTISDRYGTLLVRLPRSGKIGKTLPDSYRTILAADKEGTLRDNSFDGVSRVIGYVPVGLPPAADFFVSAGISESDALAPFNEAAYRGLALMGLAVLVGMAMAASWARRYAVPDAEKDPIVEISQPAGEMRARIALIKTGTNDSAG